MSLFIIGPTKVGKTTLARILAETLGLQYLSASSWIKQRFKPSDRAREDPGLYLDEITEFSCEKLRENWSACAEYLREQVRGQTMVIEGVRNPHDFVSLFNPHEDAVVLVRVSDSDRKQTEFERQGLAAIAAIVDFHKTTGVLAPDRVLEKVVPVPLDTDTIQELKAWVLSLNHQPVKLSTYEFVHAGITPFPVWVSELALYDGDESRTEWVQAVVFAVSSYPGHEPTFKVLLANGAMFSYVPSRHLRWCWPQAEASEVQDQDLVYHNCPEGPFIVKTFDLLSGPCRAHFKRTGAIIDAYSIMTIDWWAGNDLLHCLALVDGRIAFLPSHKILWRESGELPDYKKMRSEWVVPEDVDRE